MSKQVNEWKKRAWTLIQTYFPVLLTQISFLQYIYLNNVTLAGGEGDNRGWDGWMASPTGWTWVWVNSRSWWWTGRPSVLWFMGFQRVRHDWVTELSWTDATWVFANVSNLAVYSVNYNSFPTRLLFPWWGIFAPDIPSSFCGLSGVDQESLTRSWCSLTLYGLTVEVSN